MEEPSHNSESMETDIPTKKLKESEKDKEEMCNGGEGSDDSQDEVKMNGKSDDEGGTNGIKESKENKENESSENMDTSDSKENLETKDTDEKDAVEKSDEKDETKSATEKKSEDGEKVEDECTEEKGALEKTLEKSPEEIGKELEDKQKDAEKSEDEEKKKAEEKKQEEKKEKFRMLDNIGKDTEDMRPMAGLLYSIGADLAKQHIFKDLLRVQNKKKAKNLLETPEDEEHLDYLKKTYEVLVEKNKRFNSEAQLCPRCMFKAESRNIMEWHLEFAHGTDSSLFQCCFCEFSSKYPADFFFHVEQEHKRKGRIYMKPAFFCCPLCPFEHNSRAALSKHKPKCEKNFNLKRNLEPSPTDCDIPLKKLKPPVQKTKAAVPPPKTVAKAPVPTVTTTWQQPRPAISQVRMPLNVQSLIGNQLPIPQMPLLQQRPVTPVVSQYAIGSNMYTLVNSQGQFMLHQAGGAPGAMTRAPGVGMVAPPALTTVTTAGGMVRLQVPIMPNSQAKSLLTPQTKNMISQAATKVVASSKQNKKSSSPSPAPSVNKSGQFEICEICGGFVKDRESLRIHFYWAHKVDINKELFDRKTPHLICEYCPQRFWTYQGYTRHRQTNHKATSKDPVWKCPVCREDNIPNLLTHLNQKHNISLNMICHQKYCPMCGLTFKNEVATKQHLFTAHKQMFEKAVAASFSPSKAAKLQNPVPTGLYKNAAKTYEPVCSICDMTFPSVEAFSLHCAKMHLFRCYRCGQKWNTPELLQAHFRQAHSNVQEKCQLCSSRLTIGRPYIRHLKRTHLKESSVVLMRLPKAKFEHYHKKYLEKQKVTAKSVSSTVKAVVDAVLKNNSAVAKKKTSSNGNKSKTPVVIDLIEDSSHKNKERVAKKENINQDKDAVTLEIDGETIVIEKQDDDNDSSGDKREESSKTSQKSDINVSNKDSDKPGDSAQLNGGKSGKSEAIEVDKIQETA